MSNYTKTTNFAAKDALSSGDPNKIVKGTEIDAEFNNIATAVATKADTTVVATKLDTTAYTAADVLTKIKTVDGTGSGLDADLFQGAAASAFVKDSDYTTSAVANGYVTLPNGLIVQWGSTSVSGNQANKATSFPTAFPTACFQVVATSVVSSASEGDNWGLGSTSPTATTYYLTNGNGNTRLFRFIAIGH